MRISIKFLLFIFFISCHTTTDKVTDSKKDTRKWYYNDDSLLVIRTFYFEAIGGETDILTEKTFKIKDGDSVLHGYGKSFCRNGQLMGEEHYKNGIKHGLSQQYYANGQLKHRSWLKNGNLDSIGLAYYEDEQIKFQGYFKDGRKIDEHFYYFPDGSLREYQFYNPIGELIYLREYSMDGSLLREEGSKYPQIVIVTANENIYDFSLNDTLIARIYHISPPETESTLLVRVDGLKEKWQEVTSLSIYEPAVFTIPLDIVGYYKLEVKLKLKDKKQKSAATEHINQIEFTVQ